jgi:hypothetical protein
MPSIVETVIEGVKDYITSNIGEYLDDMERESADGLRLPNFVNVYLGDHELSAIDSFPTLMFRYGSHLIRVTFEPLILRSNPMDAALMPFPVPL